jgi:hypothetical protein
MCRVGHVFIESALKSQISTSNDKRKVKTIAKKNTSMFTGTNTFRNDMLTAQGQSVPLWRSLILIWDID